MNLTRVVTLYRSILDAYIIVRPQGCGWGAPRCVIGYLATTRGESGELASDLFFLIGFFSLLSVQERVKAGQNTRFFFFPDDLNINISSI